MVTILKELQREFLDRIAPVNEQQHNIFTVSELIKFKKKGDIEYSKFIILDK